MNEPKNQDVKGVLIVYADGLTGIKEAIVVIFPKIGYRCCILPFLELRKNGLVRIRKWAQVYSKLSIMHEGRLPE